MKHEKFYKFLSKNVRWFSLAVAVLSISSFVFAFFPLFIFTPENDIYPYATSFNFFNYGFGGIFYNADGTSYVRVTPSFAGWLIIFSIIVIFIIGILLAIFSFKKNIARVIFSCVIQDFFLTALVFIAIIPLGITTGALPDTYLGSGFTLELIISIIVSIILLPIIPFLFTTYIYDRKASRKKLQAIIDDNKVKQKSTIQAPKTDERTISLLKQYKELLDNGVITKEEFEEKKKKLLD